MARLSCPGFISCRHWLFSCTLLLSIDCVKRIKDIRKFQLVRIAGFERRQRIWCNAVKPGTVGLHQHAKRLRGSGRDDHGGL